MTDSKPDRTGLIALVGEHRSELRAFLAARCGDTSDAEDLLQELWLKVSSRPSGPIANSRAYLFQIANNLALDRIRARHRAMRRDRVWLESESDPGAAIEDRPDRSLRADETLQRDEEAALVREAVSQLPAGARRALELYRLEGLEQAEVARIMGISRSGVEKHLATAMRHLRRALADCGYFDVAASSRQGQSSHDHEQG